MNIKQFTHSTRTDSLQCTESYFIHVVPDFGYSFHNLISTSGLSLTNCESVVCKTKITKVGDKSFNAKEILLQTKKSLSSDPNKTKNLTIVQSIPPTISDKKYVIIDHTMSSKTTEYIYDLKKNEKMVLLYLSNQIIKDYSICKSRNPLINNIVLFLFKDYHRKSQYSIIDLFKNINKLSDNDINTNFKIFDKFIFGSVCNSIPKINVIANYDSKGNIEFNKNNINLIYDIISSVSDENITTVIPSDNPVSDEKLEAIKDTIFSNKGVKETKDSDGNIVLNVNEKELSKVLKKLKVQDKTIADNIKSAINKYIEKNKDSLKEDDLELVVLKSIHKSLFGNDEIDQKYLNSPALLINKLIEEKTFKKKLKYIEPSEPHLISPADVIYFDTISGLVRQEYEFGENLHDNVKTLIKTLESRTKYPIKILDIKHEYQDNHLNRSIKFTFKLQNTYPKTAKNEPYDVSVKLPAIVNDKYVKINGKEYIFAQQLFFIPITKTTPNECRFLTSFSTITLNVVNMKFNVSEIDKILYYISTTYPDLIKNIEYNKLNNITKIYFNNNMVIDLIAKIEEPIYSYKDDSDNIIEELYLNSNNEYIVKTKSGESKIERGHSEYVYNKIIDMLIKVNPSEKLQKTSRSIPYIQVHIAAIKIPLIIYLWHQIGLMNALIKLGIDCSIIDKKSYIRENNSSDFIVDLKDDKFLVIKPEDKRDELIINGLIVIEIKKMKLTSDDVKGNKEAISNYITSKYGSRVSKNLDYITENIVDPITKSMLDFQDKPTSTINIITDEMLNKLLNDKSDSISDLKLYRIRQAEIMFQILYRELLIAHNNYVKEVDFGKEDSKMFLNENYVIECLLGVHPHMRGSSTLELSNPYSPISELKNASKIIKTGPGGIPNKESFKKEHRNIHNSYIGNISANFNSEYAEIGIINYSTLNPSLTKLGSYGTKEIDNNTEGWEYVSLNEGLVPNVNQGDSARLHLASWHRSQATPTKNSDVPIVATGAEYMVGQLSSSKFIKLAPNAGEVLEVKKDEYVKVKYIDGTIQYIDITPRLSSTKRASYMMIDFKTLEKDDLFDEGQAISWSNSFNKDGIYAGGKNLKTAILNYRGYGFEDGYVLTEDISKKFEIDVLEEVNVLIPPNTKLLYVNDKIGDVTKKNDVLLEFTYMGSVDEYIDKFVQIDNMSSEDEIAFYTKNIDNIKLHSPGGEIVLIKVFINNKNLTDPSILNLWENNNSKLKEKIKLYSTGMISDKDKLTSTDNIDTSVLKTGSHKHYGKLFDGTKISFFIKQSKNIKIGDKMCNRYGAKGVNTYIIPNDKKPRCESLGDIDIFIAPTAILGRKNLVIIKELYLGKILYLFPDILSKMANNTKTKTKDILDLILTVYTELDASRDRRYISAVKKKFNKIKPEKLREMIKNKELRLNFFVQPFENISFDKLKNTAELLNIELDEYVYIPELDSWTKEKVPVGINYFNIMEQISSDFETVRSVGAYNTISGQPKQGGREGYSSQAIGNLDIYNLLSYDCPNIMKALMTVRSDDFKSKRIVEMNIIQNGFASLPQHTGNARSRSLKKVHLICMGLDVRTEE